MTVELKELGAEIEKLAESAALGEDVILSRDGEPFVMLTVVKPLEKPTANRVGGLAHLGIKIPDDIDTPFEKDIRKMFYGTHE